MQVQNKQHTYHPGFGELEGVNAQKWVKTLNKTQKIAAIALGFSAVATLATAIILPTSSLCLILAGATLVFGLSLIFIRKKLSSMRGLKLKQDPKTLLAPGELSKKSVSGRVLKNAKEANQVKLDLIKKAKHNVVLSGNYCGGKIFDEMLGVFSEKLEKNPQFKVLMLSSPDFINKNNQKQIVRLYKKYPQRFQFVITPVSIVSGHKTKRVTNHTKALSIDYGRAVMVGSEGIEDRYTFNGLKKLTQEDKRKIKQDSLFEKILPIAFYDSAILLVDKAKEKNIGEGLHAQLIHLANRWKGLKKQKFCSKQFHIKKRCPTLDRIQTTVINEKKWAKNFQAKILVNAPEHHKSRTGEEIIKGIQKAKKEIVIAHNYFHPNKAILEELAKAVDERNVKVKIITSGYQKGKSPIAQRVYCDNNRLGYYLLNRRIKKKKNVEYREFLAQDVIYHKKVFLADNWVISGNGNLGYKSMTVPTDYELNFSIQSKALTQQVQKILAKDLDKSKKVSVSQLKINWVKGMAYHWMRSLLD